MLIYTTLQAPAAIKLHCPRGGGRKNRHGVDKGVAQSSGGIGRTKARMLTTLGATGAVFHSMTDRARPPGPVAVTEECDKRCTNHCQRRCGEGTSALTNYCRGSHGCTPRVHTNSRSSSRSHLGAGTSSDCPRQCPPVCKRHSGVMSTLCRHVRNFCARDWARRSN